MGYATNIGGAGGSGALGQSFTASGTSSPVYVSFATTVIDMPEMKEEKPKPPIDLKSMLEGLL